MWKKKIRKGYVNCDFFHSFKTSFFLKKEKNGEAFNIFYLENVEKFREAGKKGGVC